MRGSNRSAADWSQTPLRCQFPHDPALVATIHAPADPARSTRSVVPRRRAQALLSSRKASRSPRSQVGRALAPSFVMTSLSRPSLESQGWQTTKIDRRPHSREKLGGSSSRYLGVHHRPFEDLLLRLRRHSLPSRHRRGHPLAARAADHVSAHRCASSQASRTVPRRVPARVGSR